MYDMAGCFMNLYFLFSCGASTRFWVLVFCQGASRSHSLHTFSPGKTPLEELSARHRDPYLKTHNTHNRQTAVPPSGFEHTIPAGERPQTHALDVLAGEIGSWPYIFGLNQRLLLTPAVDEMSLSIMKTATFDKLFELCKVMIRWNVECDLTIEHYSL